MGLAAPTAVTVAIGRAAQMGVIIKGGEVLEALAQVKRLGFDKTGTLTSGTFVLDRILVEQGTQQELQSIVRSLESHSNHPVARSLVTICSAAPLVPLHFVNDNRAAGMEGQDASGRTYWIRPSQNVSNDDWISSGLLLVSFDVGIDSTRYGQIFVKDSIALDALESVTALMQLGIIPFMLSGDSHVKASAVAHQMGIPSAKGGCSPQDKLQELLALRSEGPVAFVGDGSNDALALSAATVGFALSKGSDTALKSGHVVLLNHSLEAIPLTIRLARATYRTILWNYVWAFGYNLVAIPLAVTGIVSPALGAFAMALSDVVVVGNSLLLRVRRIP
jgi:Cu+-exporting ATPase